MRSMQKDHCFSRAGYHTITPFARLKTTDNSPALHASLTSLNSCWELVSEKPDTYGEAETPCPYRAHLLLS